LPLQKKTKKVFKFKVHFSKVPIFVVNDLVGKSVDFWAQRLALQLGNPDFPFVMILDDSITGFTGKDHL
jgi:hypothetical protein